MKSSLLLATLLCAASLVASFAQTAPSQPVDPTAQSPSTIAPATPPTFPSGAKQPKEGANDFASTAESSKQGTTQALVGTIVKKRHAYFLKVANAEYLLEDHGEAKNYKGKRVKVTGTFGENDVIRVETMEPSPMM